MLQNKSANMYGFQEPAKFDGNGNGEIACSSKILIQSTYIKVDVIVISFTKPNINAITFFIFCVRVYFFARATGVYISKVNSSVVHGPIAICL